MPRPDAKAQAGDPGRDPGRMKVGFIGLGNVGGKLAGSVLRNGFELTVLDLNRAVGKRLLARGAAWADTPRELAERVDMVVTCLPSPAACSQVMEAADGVLAGLGPGTIWAEMSTTDDKEVRRIGALVKYKGAEPVDCPVSGGCHRAATGNISIFVGGERTAFDKIFPVMSAMGGRILHTGPLGSASMLKVLTNYLATANLVTLCEALVTAKKAGLDLATAYEAIRVSSGNSFVHETESQVILNGSRNIHFTMDLVIKDIGLFQAVAERVGVPLEISPLILEIFRDGAKRYGERECSPNIIRRLEDVCGVRIHAPGFPPELADDEEEEPGHEVRVPGRSP